MHFVAYQVVPKERALHQLKALEEAGRVADLLAAVRECEGHASVVFPHCPSDARKEGHVIPVVAFDGFKLRACTEDGRAGTRHQDPTLSFCYIRSVVGSGSGIFSLLIPTFFFVFITFMHQVLVPQ